MPALAAPAFLGINVSGDEERPVSVYAGASTEFVVTLTSDRAIEPEATFSLSAIAGTLVAPLAKEARVELRRVGSVHAGVQRFGFRLDVPKLARPQRYLLQLQARFSEKEAWLPLPSVVLAAEPKTWPESLQQLSRDVAIGRLEGGAQLEEIFREAGIRGPVLSSDTADPEPQVRIWFAEVDRAFRVPETPGAVWFLVKSGASNEVELQHDGSPRPVVVLDAEVLRRLDADATAQRAFARALSLARMVLSSPGPANPNIP